MERASNKNFELVFDCTLFSQANEIPNQYIIQLVQLLPFDACDNIANIVFYNPNSHLRKFMKKFPRPISHKLAKRFNFAVTLAEIYDYISPNELRLPKTTSKKMKENI